MSLDFSNDLKKKEADYGTDIRIRHTLNTRVGEPGGGGGTGRQYSTGDAIDGGGVVSEASGTRVAVAFPEGTVAEHVDLGRAATTVETQLAPTSSTDRGGGIYVRGQGPAVGQHLEDGGVVTAVGTDTVTISYPNGAPQGPVMLPWVKTTIVQESSGTSDEGGHPGSASSFDGGGLSLGDLGGVVDDEVELGHTPGPPRIRVRLPNPGGGAGRFLKLEPQDLIKFTNDARSPCFVTATYLDENLVVLFEVQVDPGQTVTRLSSPPGAAHSVLMAAVNCRPGNVVVSWQQRP